MFQASIRLQYQRRSLYLYILILIALGFSTYAIPNADAKGPSKLVNIKLGMSLDEVKKIYSSLRMLNNNPYYYRATTDKLSVSILFNRKWKVYDVSVAFNTKGSDFADSVHEDLIVMYGKPHYQNGYSDKSGKISMWKDEWHFGARKLVLNRYPQDNDSVVVMLVDRRLEN